MTFRNSQDDSSKKYGIQNILLGLNSITRLTQIYLVFIHLI